MSWIIAQPPRDSVAVDRRTSLLGWLGYLGGGGVIEPFARCVHLISLGVSHSARAARLFQIRKSTHRNSQSMCDSGIRIFDPHMVPGSFWRHQCATKTIHYKTKRDHAELIVILLIFTCTRVASIASRHCTRFIFLLKKKFNSRAIYTVKWFNLTTMTTRCFFSKWTG